jgi:uncharacterized protein YxjI
MRYAMRQKIFCLGDQFAIADADGRDRFLVKEKLISLGRQLVFTDLAGQELACIRQRLMCWCPTYEIYREGRLAAVVEKGVLPFFSCRFTIDVPGPNDLEANGDLPDWEYSFERAGRPVAQVSKQLLNWSDTYGIDIADGEDDVLILASAVVIDLVCHDNRRQ